MKTKHPKLGQRPAVTLENGANAPKLPPDPEKSKPMSLQDKISAREAELRNLNQDYSQKSQQFQQFHQQCQVRANFLEGMIAAHKEELAEKKPKQ